MVSDIKASHIDGDILLEWDKGLGLVSVKSVGLRGVLCLYLTLVIGFSDVTHLNVKGAVERAENHSHNEMKRGRTARKH